jgi:hypothetical protein
MVRLSLLEMYLLNRSWMDHRTKCDHNGDVTLDHKSGGGIGTVTHLTCGCGKIMDITDYSSW